MHANLIATEILPNIDLEWEWLVFGANGIMQFQSRVHHSDNTGMADAEKTLPTEDTKENLMEFALIADHVSKMNSQAGATVWKIGIREPAREFLTKASHTIIMLA